MVAVLDFVEWLTDRLSRGLMVAAALWAFALAVYILIDVLGRTVGLPIKGTNEIVKNSIVMIAFMQVCWSIKSGTMIRADFLIHMFGPRLRRFVNATGYILAVVLLLILIFGTWADMWPALASGEFEGEGALRVPTWPGRFVIFGTAIVAAANYLLLALHEIVTPFVDGADAPAGE